MDIPGGDEAMVALLTQRGLVRDVAEIYRLKVKELAALPGLDPTAAQKFFDAITASMKRDAWRVIFGLSIQQIGTVEAQSLARAFPHVDIALAAGVERLISAGLTETAAQSVIRWYGDGINRKLLKRLEKFGVNLKFSRPV
jgi:DNA ligase (NAD+)